MVSIKRGIKLLLENRSLFCDSFVKNFLKFLPDKVYLSLRYRLLMGNRIQWQNPKTFTEKIQWLKLYDRQPEYTTMVDKFAVKQYVSSRIGEEYIIPTIGVWETPEEIDWNTLPDQFVLKTTHGGGSNGILICKDKSRFNTKMAIDSLKSSLSVDIYEQLREWPYKNVRKRIIAEMYIQSSESLIDYKFFCFNGKVRFFKMDIGRFIDHRAYYFTPQGTLLDFSEQELASDADVEFNNLIPTNLDHMVRIAETLSQGVPFLRVDLYNVQGQIYFGELTFYPASGLGKWTSPEVDLMIGSYLTI